jgi:GNAT superfamily N-acetyltransferase
MPHELRHGDYLLSDDPARLSLDVVHDYLSRQSYWAAGIPRDYVETSLKNSLCLGVYFAGLPAVGTAQAGEQVGLARVVTDYATYGWICDVFVLDAHRGHGLGKALVQAIVSHPRLQTLRRLALATQDAHGLYASFGFKPLAAPDRHMERRNAIVYQSHT